MGDRCTLSVIVRNEDLDHLIAEALPDIGEPETIIDHGPSMSLVTWDEVNYAAWVDSGEPGPFPTDIQYHGWHGEGMDYSASVFACIGNGKPSDFVLCLSADCSSPMVVVGADMSVDPSDMQQAASYWAVVERMRKVNP